MSPRLSRKLAFTALLLPLALLLAAGSLAPTSSKSPLATEDARVVILGFDGADGRTIEELMAAQPGAYPNFERLASEGTFARLGTIAPPESPVSWAALNTGQNPAKTGVPGFVKRINDPATIPTFGHLVDNTAPGKRAPLSDFDNAPIPAWSAGWFALLVGGLAFLFFLGIFALLLHLRKPLAVVLALILGAVGGVCGHNVRGLLPEEYPRYGNPNQARNFWDYLADDEVDSIILDAAQAFDMPSGARVLAGLGVPDASGKIGDWAIYTTSDEVFTELKDGGEGTGTAGKKYRVFERDGKIESRILGPKNFWAEDKLRKKIAALDEKLEDPSLGYSDSLDYLEKKRETQAKLDEVIDEGTWLPLLIEPGSDKTKVSIGGEEQELAVGEWSDYYHLTFELNWLIKVHAITRVKLMQTEPNLELYVNVLDIDPEKPPFWQAISTPFAFSAELAKDGPYETYGWPTATMPFKDEVVTSELMMEDVEFTMKWRERLTYAALQRDDWQCFMSVFSTTDRVQHMMYQYYDEGHPMYDEAEASKTFEFFGETIARKEAIPHIYKQMDRILGVVIDEHLGPNDTLLVCSDHGFQSFRRQVHINNWLAEKGYLKTRSPLIPGRAPRGNGSSLAFIDWSGTRAYCVGLGFIYLNLKGREPNGIVDPADADALIAQIKADLLAYEDEATGLRVANDVYVVSEIHNGPYLKDEADLITGFAPTYRVSWGTTLGGLSIIKDANGVGVAGPVCVDNDKNWSGGHVSVALPDVAGVFFSNRKVSVPEDGLSALHIAPTALDLMGVAVPAEMDKGPLALQ